MHVELFSGKTGVENKKPQKADFMIIQRNGGGVLRQMFLPNLNV